MSTGNVSRLADRRVTEWFLREKARHEARVPITPERPILASVITLSRLYGAGGHTVAEMVAERLGPQWRIWDREIIEAVSRNSKVRTEMVESLDERTQSWMEQVIRHAFGVPTLDVLAYRHHLAQVMLALAQQGKAVVIGRGANFLLPDALNVRLRAPLDFRIQRVMRMEGLDRDAAIIRVHHVDAERANFTHAVFDRNVDDPDSYDITLQTNALGFPGAAAAICAAAHARAEATPMSPAMALVDALAD